MDKRTFIFTIFCLLSFHLSFAVSEESKNQPLPKLEELQLPLLPIEEGQSESKNGDIQQPRSAQEVSSVRNKTSEGSVTDLSSPFSSDADDKDSYSDDDIEDVSSQPKHVTESDVQSEETATGSSSKEDELADPVDIEQKSGGNRQQMPSNTQQFPPGQTLPNWFRHLWPNDTFQDPEVLDDADYDGVDGFSDFPIDDSFYFFDYDHPVWDTLAVPAPREQSETTGESQTNKQDRTVASSDYREQSVGQDQDQFKQDQSQSEQDVSTDIDWKLFMPDSDGDDEESVSDDGTVTDAGFGDEKQTSSHELFDVEDDDDDYDYDSYDDNENDSINNSTAGYEDENDETMYNPLGIDRIDEEHADDITGKDKNLDDGESNVASNEGDEDKVADITGKGENLNDNDTNSVSWESDEDDDSTVHNITGNRENMNSDNDDGFSDKLIDIIQSFIQSPVRTGSGKDDSDKNGKLDKDDTESEEEDYKSDKDDSQEEDEINPSKEHNGAVVDHDAEEDDDDDDDDEYFVWPNINEYHDKSEDLEDEKDGNEDDDDDEEFDETNEDFTGEAYELAKKSKQPTAPSSMILFYTWMVVAVLIVIIIISIYRAHCKGFRFLGMKAALDRRDDRKRLIEHETV